MIVDSNLHSTSCADCCSRVGSRESCVFKNCANAFESNGNPINSVEGDNGSPGTNFPPILLPPPPFHPSYLISITKLLKHIFTLGYFSGKFPPELMIFSEYFPSEKLCNGCFYYYYHLNVKMKMKRVVSFIFTFFFSFLFQLLLICWVIVVFVCFYEDILFLVALWLGCVMVHKISI